ncbi:LA_3478 family PerA/PerB upregulated protein [Leptospira brenneri]|uniref:LA_3478 family PerA/PerB upregulated protein n=1 Tax=Leptospira brenneri TaxID=2023182 RepID=UPI0026C4037D
MKMQKTNPVLNLKNVVLLLFIVFFINCIESNSGKVPPLITANVTPYTPGDLGIPTPPADSPLATLPAISNNERAAIEETFQMMAENGQLDQKFVKESSVASRNLLMNRPLTDAELEARVEAELKGQSYPVPTYGSEQAVLQKESEAADAFYGRIASDLPTLTVPELVKVRENFTLSLVMIRFMIDYGTTDNGIPTSFLIMAREKAVAIRQKVNEELIKRGVTTL